MDTEAVAAVAPPLALAHLGSLLIRQSLEQVAHLANEHSTKVLSALAWASVNVVFIVMLRSMSESEQPLLILLYTSLVLFYTALYLRRLLRGHAVLHRGLGYAAAGLAALLSVLFFYFSFARGIPLPLAVGAWLLLAVPAAYCFYRVFVLHLDDEEEAMAAVRMQAPPQVRPAV